MEEPSKGESGRPARPRCEQHGLAVGPDGRCALCRRSEASARPSGGRWWRAALLGVIVVGASAAAAHRYLTRRSRQETVVARAPTNPNPVPAPEATEEPVAWPAPSAEPAAASEETSPDAAPAAAPSDAGTSNAQRPPAAQLSRRAEDPQLLLAAIRRVPITMYLTSWCPACRKAQAWWRANQLSVTEHDIDKDESAKQRCRALSGETSIPQFEIDGSAFVGFRPTAMWQTLTRAARRELDAMR